MITTNRINLRKFSQSDIQSLQTLFSDPQVMAYSGGTLRPPDVQTWLQTRLESYEVNDGIWIFAVELRSTGEMIGYCGLSHLQDMDGNIEIEVGYRLQPAFWGRGLATEAVLAVKEYAFSGLKLNRLMAMIDPANDQSIRVAQKAGLHFEREIMMEGYDHPDHLFVVDWRDK